MHNILSIYNTIFNGAKRGLPYPTEVITFNESLTTSLSVAELNRLSRFVYRIKTGWGVSDLSEVADGIYIRSGETQESSLKNLANPTQNSIAVNAPSWTKDVGFDMNGSNQYIRVGLIPNTMTRYTLNDAGYAIFTRSRIEEAITALGGSLQTSPTRFNQIVPKYAQEINAAVNGVNEVEDNYTFDKGMYAFFRDGSATARGYINSIKKIIGTSASVALTTIEFYEGARNLNGSAGAYFNGIVAFSYYGQTLTEYEYLIMLRAYELYQREKSKGILSLAEINTTKDQISELLIYQEGVDFTGINGNIDAKFRIPYITKTDNGVILAGTEARHGSITDYAMSDLVLKRSTDNGATWGSGFKVVENNGVATTINHGSRVLNPTILHNNGRTFLFCTKIDDDTALSYYGADLDESLFQFGYKYSDDDGVTWSAFINLSSLYSANTNAYAAGPGNGIVTADGTLVVPFCDYRHSSNTAETGTDWGIRVGLLYSTDNGSTWQISNLIPQFTDEPAVVEYDNKLYIISRSLDRYNRVFYTEDMGATWVLDTLRDKAIETFPTQMTLLKYGSKFLFVAPFGPNRSDLRMRVTDNIYDFNNVYQFAPHGQQTYGYSGLVTDSNLNLFALTEKLGNIAFWNMSVIKNEI